jgi:hypothetical protein
VTPKKVQEATTNELSDFLMDAFDAVHSGLSDRKKADMAGYALLAQFLSNRMEFAQAAAELADAIARMLQKLRNDDKFMVDFLGLLGFFAHCFGFSRNIYTLSGQLKPEAFARVVSQKVLFRDNYTRNHGEFSHAVQWLVMASQFDGKLPIADLYANSVSYSSGKKGFFLGHDKAGKAEHRPVEMWNFLVDCFAGEEDYRSNIFCETFRCPQIVTNQLQAVLPSENWLGEFLHQRRHLGLRKGAKPPPGSHYSVKRDIIWRKPYAKRMLATYYDEVEKGIYKLKDGSLR